jgi:hypothetical protein
MMEKGRKTWFMRLWKVEGALHKPKDMIKKLIVALMSEKGSLGNVGLFHTYLVIDRAKIKFGKELGASQFIGEVNNDRNGKFVFDGQFVESTEVRTHSPRTLFLQYHDNRRGYISFSSMHCWVRVIQHKFHPHFL